MTSNVVSVDWGTISQSRSYFKVNLEDENWKISVPSEKVSKASMATGQDEYLVAVLFAYVSYIRQNTLAPKNKVEKLEDEVVMNAMINLINGYEHSMQSLINQIKELKWHELRWVILSKEPAATLYEIT